MSNPKSFSVLSKNENIRSHYLLEASAGTGKTFTIENLVVRFLIEEPRLKINEILLVTFTRMATRELKQRISHQIDKALEILQHNLKDKAFDYLSPWMEDDIKLKQAKRSLEDALASFDEAQIFTIHSFCEKMLGEYGEGLETHLSQGQVSSKMLLQLIHNYYRVGMKEGNLSAAQLEILLKNHQNNLSKLDHALLKLVKNSKPIQPQLTFQQLFIQVNEILKEQFNISPHIQIASKAHTNENLSEIFLSYLSQFKKGSLKIAQETIEDSVNSIIKVMRGGSVDKETFERWIEQGLDCLTMISPDNLKKNLKNVVEHPFISSIEKFCSLIFPLIERARDPLHILSAVGGDLQKIVKHYLVEEEKYRFDDLLDAMVKALSSPQFVASVSTLYKAVIIDEFQDTDRQQWKIFETLFHHQNCHLYLVGDPKQSIYAFRQADIYTYLSASKKLGEKCFATLDTNYRSQKPLIEALNSFFMQAPGLISLPATKGHLPFHPVHAGCADVLPFEDDKKALHSWIMEQEMGRSRKWPTEDIESSLIFPTICQEIIRMHRSYGIAWDRWALLIKDRYQGKRLMDYLHAHGVPAVAQKEDSLADAAALPLFREVVQAVIHPKNESKVKIALCSPLFNMRLETIDLEEAFENFLYCRSLFYQEGIASMFSHLLSSGWGNSKESVAENLICRHDGETLLRDLRQICELLSQFESDSKATPQQVFNYLNYFEELELIDEDHLKIRQDTERGAVNILTMHMSKGLEFDFVVALGAASRVKNRAGLVLIDEMLTPCAKDDPKAVSHRRELDAEKIRQLYVAMTRAKYRLYLPIVLQSDQKKGVEIGEASPLELYFKKTLGDDNFSYEQVYRLLSSLPQTSIAPFEEFVDSFPLKPSLSLSPPESLDCSIHKKFVSSFSSLSKGNNDAYHSMSSPQDFNAADKNCHTLPAGPETGLIIHSLFELLPLSLIKKASSSEELVPFVESQLQNSLYAPWCTILAEMLWNTFTTPLTPEGWTLREIQENQCFREIEFFYGHMNNYLKGVIDFIFFHEGKYYIVDWKSNWLGEDQEAYHQQALAGSMEAHQYHLQAEIYQEALRRYLRVYESRQFEHCFGGTFYLFLRGIVSPHQQGIYHIPYQEISYVNR